MHDSHWSFAISVRLKSRCLRVKFEKWTIKNDLHNENGDGENGGWGYQIDIFSRFWKLYELYGLWYFKIHYPMIHNPTMHDSCINYPNKLKLCREMMQLEKWILLNKKTELLL